MSGLCFVPGALLSSERIFELQKSATQWRRRSRAGTGDDNSECTQSADNNGVNGDQFAHVLVFDVLVAGVGERIDMSLYGFMFCCKVVIWIFWQD